MKPLGHDDLTRILRYARAGFDLNGIAIRTYFRAKEVDLILFAKLGRSIPETVDIVNSPGWQARAA